MGFPPAQPSKGFLHSLVSAAEGAAFGVAISGGPYSNQKLVLLPGARILGKIRLGVGITPRPRHLNGDMLGDGTPTASGTETGNIGDIIDLSQYRDSPQTLDLRNSGAEKIILSGGKTITKNTDGTIDYTHLAQIDHTGASATRMALGAATAQIHRLVSRRILPELPQDTDGTQTQRHGWGTLFGDRLSRGNDGRANAWSSNRFGVIGGYETLLSGGQRVGLFAGTSKGRIKTDVSSVKIDTNGGFVGAYGQRFMGGLGLDGSLVIGYDSHDSERGVADNEAGEETANGDYGSLYVSPSLSLAWSNALGNGVEFRPSGRVAYTYGRYNDYNESGTTNSDLRFGDRKVNILDSRLQLEFARETANKLGEFSARTGATHTRYGDNSIDVTSVDFTSANSNIDDLASSKIPGKRTDTAWYVGARFNYAVKESMELTGDVEYQQGEGSSLDSVSGYLGLRVLF